MRRTALVNRTTVKVTERVPGTWGESRTVATFDRPRDRENFRIALEELGVVQVLRAKDGAL